MEIDPRKYNAGSPGYRLAALALCLAFLVFMSWMTASNFDETELKMILPYAGGALLVTFLPDVARRLFGGGR